MPCPLNDRCPIEYVIRTGRRCHERKLANGRIPDMILGLEHYVLAQVRAARAAIDFALENNLRE